MASNGVNGTASALKTRILPIKSSGSEPTAMGCFADPATLSQWVLPSPIDSALQEAATHLRSTSVPVAFPTETVYGLGADATRSEAVKGIYAAKGRPSDNPLIIHVSDLAMLRSLVSPTDIGEDPIPQVYKPLIAKFWPGPLTILLPNPSPSKLAPEVTAGLQTFGARMPDSPLALSLIALAGVPLAAPSANASTKPSPTTAEHVLHDLHGRIEVILDGGPCAVGVESTVVDGLCEPPVVLRPGGVSLEDIRTCPGWQACVKAYKDKSEVGEKGIAPRAPGMKYKHYSPKARVVLFETTCPVEGLRNAVLDEMFAGDLGVEEASAMAKIGIIRTKRWPFFDSLFPSSNINISTNGFIPSSSITTAYPVEEGTFKLEDSKGMGEVIAVQMSLSPDTKVIAHSLFSALRDLDERAVDVIFVEGIDDQGDIAAAVMNRLRKAASVIKS